MAENYPWFKSYPSFAPHEIDPEKYKSLIDILERAVAKFKDLPSIENMGKSISFNELNKFSDAFAWYLQNKTNLKPGDRVAIQMPNIIQFPIAVFGILKAGMIVVTVNPLYTAEEMLHQFTDLGVKGIVILENFAFNLEKIKAETTIETIIIASVGDMLGAVKRTIVNFVVRNIKKMVPKYNLENYVKFNDTINILKKPLKINLSSKDIALLINTGGTTGVSKGVTLSHGNICANMAQVDGWLGNVLEEGKEIFITPLPLYHIFSFTANLILGIHLGGKIKLITNPRNMKAFIKELKKEKFSFFSGVNTLFNGLLNQPSFSEVDFSGLKITLAGGMALQDVVSKKWEKTTGNPVIEAYGLSETSPGASVNPIDGNHKIGSIGLPLPSTIFKLLDDNGNEVPQGQPGEIAIKGPQVMLGYWQKPEENAKVFKGDFLLTGDIGVMDEDGFFKIVDRKKEMIIVSGFNVFPNEIEKVIAEHPGVLEVGVRGVADEKTTEAVKAFIVKRDAKLNEEEIKEFCKQRLTPYKVPKYIVFRDELPKSNIGKILRRKLE
ncbi:MAG: AMP-binding protein [Bacteroidetes bacterium]|nr:AMP-binding protein [Bacteroidota bacterium]